MRDAADDRDQVVLARHGGRCVGSGVNPGCTGVAIDPHELIPVGAGGKRVSENRVGVCRCCHNEAQGRVGGLRLRFHWASGRPNADIPGNVMPWWDATAGKVACVVVSVFYLRKTWDGQVQVVTDLRRGWGLKALQTNGPTVAAVVDIGRGWVAYSRTVLQAFLGFAPITEVVNGVAEFMGTRLPDIQFVQQQLDAADGTEVAMVRSDILESWLEDMVTRGTLSLALCWRCADSGTNQEGLPCSCGKGRAGQIGKGQ